MGFFMDFDYDFNKQDRFRRRRKDIIKIVIFTIQIALVILIAYFIVKFTIERTNVPGKSMEATLMENDSIVINKFSYMIGNPERFDIIVFNQSGREHSYYDIKRVIGLPGERIQIMDGAVFINGELLEEPMVVEEILIAGLVANEIKLDEDEYFVLGDNRNYSEDSRFVNIGNVVREDIIGRVWMRTNKFGFVHQFNLEVNKVSGDDRKD